MTRSALWRNRDFVHLWSAYTVSEFGSQITLLALPLTAIGVLHASVFEISVLSTFSLLPMLLFGPLAGVWVDRRRHRPVLVAADFVRFALLGSVPVAYGLGALTLAQLYAVAFLAGVMQMLFLVASHAYIPSLLEREHLIGANTRLETSRALAGTGGPGFGGVLVNLVSAPVAIAGDALSFLFSGLAILSIRHREPPPHAEPAASVARELREGLRYVFSDPILRANVLSAGPANFSYGITWGVLIVFAVRDLGLHAAAIGLILSLAQLGGLTGAALAGRLSRRFGLGPTMIAACMLVGPDTLIVALAPRSAPIPSLALGWGLGSFTSIVTGIVGVSIRQAIVPLRLQGRVVGSIRWIILGVVPLGSAAGGALASHVGLRDTLLVSAGIAFVTAVPLVLSPLRRLRTID